ncbi:MAG: hypothetical protein OHK0039_40830 [Bacteroidia bacterium]
MLRLPHIPYMVLLLAALLAVYQGFHFQEGNNGNRIWSDAEGGYLYLPALFIYGGFDSLPTRTQGQFAAYPGTTRTFTRNPYVVSLFEAPFFLVAHALVRLGLAAEDPGDLPGRSLPYSSHALLLAACCYAWLALLLLYRMLRPVHGPLASLLAVLALFFGTNLYYYTLGEPGMPHVYGFFLTSLLLSLRPGMLEPGKTGQLVLAGLALGLLTLLSRLDWPLLLVFLVWDARPGDALRRQAGRWGLVLLCMALAWLPQLIYWRYLSGRWIVPDGIHMPLSHAAGPRVLRVLFDVQNGWLIYSPLIFVALLGLILLVAQGDRIAQVTVLALVVATYLFGSSAVWWFGGAFGHRCYVDYLPLLAAPLAHVFGYVHRSWPLYRVLWYAALLYLTVFGALLAHAYAYPWEGPDWTWDSFTQVVERLHGLVPAPPR